MFSAQPDTATSSATPKGYTASPTIVPRPGESMVAAIFRLHDPHHGAGFSDMDRLAMICERKIADAQKIADLEQALDEALKVNAELLAALAEAKACNDVLLYNNGYYQRRVLALAADVDRLRAESAARLQLMNDAYELIDSLQDMLAMARPECGR